MTVYIDSTAGGGGNGTIGTPYNSFTEVNALTGDQGGETFALKAGSVFREELAIGFSGFAGAYNYTITSYGDGEVPVIKCSDDITATSWTAAGSDWYITETTGHTAVWVDGVLMRAVSLIGSMGDDTSFYDSGTNRLYIRPASGDPNSATLVEQQANRSAAAGATDRDKCLRIYQATAQTANTDVTVEKINLVGGYDGLWVSNVRDNVVIQDLRVIECVTRESGNNPSGSGAGDGMILYAKGSAAEVASLYPKGLVVRRNYCYFNSHYGIEFWGFEGANIDSNSVVNNGAGIEVWGYVKNSTIQRNIIKNCVDTDELYTDNNDGIFIATAAVGAYFGNSDNITIKNNVVVGADKPAVRVLCGTHTLSGNYLEGGRSGSSNPYALFADALPNSTTTLRLNNNVFHTRVSSSYITWAAGTPPSATEKVVTSTTSDYNCYWDDDDAGNFTNVRHQPEDSAVTSTTLADLKSNVVHDQNSVSVDPRQFFVDIDNGDFRLRGDAPFSVGPYGAAGGTGEQSIISNRIIKH